MRSTEPRELLQYIHPKFVLKFKFLESLFIRNINFCCQNVLQFYTEHDSDTAVLYAKFQNDQMTGN